MPINNFHLGNTTSSHAIYANLFTIAERNLKFEFTTHYHPYVDELIEKLNRDGLLSLMDPIYLANLKYDLNNLYSGANLVRPFPNEEIDLTDDGPYSIYNWELFFHAPMAVACHLSKNQKFEEARNWFHFIFNPTNDDASSVPGRFWNFLRFRNETNPLFILDVLEALSDPSSSTLKTRTQKSIEAWRNKPFMPHVIARGRSSAYQMNVVMKYLDNLIAWGDSLFRQDTMESLNEATQLYVLAANILGPRPQKVPPVGKRPKKSFAQLGNVDDFGNAMVEMENDFPFNSAPTTTNPGTAQGTSSLFGIGRTLYFCIPQNDKLLSYWDTVADRLFKMRHCMNFEGVVRQLALFDPPIDPGMLVKAAAAGIDMGSIVNNINQPISNIRGNLLLQKAIEVCNEVKSLGGALLSAIEKSEAEHITLLRQKHEINILNLTQDVKFLQWKESEAATDALLKSRDSVFERYRHYKLILKNPESEINKFQNVDILRKELTEETFEGVYQEFVGKYAVNITKEAYRQENSVGGLMEFAGSTVTGAAGGELGKTLPLNKNENAELNIFLPTSDHFNSVSMVLRLISPILGLIPQFKLAAEPMGLGAGITFGGQQLKSAATAGSGISKEIANAFASSAERASKMASYYRRAEDYVFQANSAANELMQYGRQIISSLIREQIVKKEYDNHLKQIEQAQEIETFLKSKFTQEELYVWMQGAIFKIYFDSYKFAYDIAKRAEQTMKYELMRPEFDNLNIIKFGYWDSERKGLLAGETLSLDLKRLEMAYHDNNIREYEITKHVSLQRLDPTSLLNLKAKGWCEIEIPEWLYDMDNPGQHMRRIKTVAISIPCITGPYTSVNCKVSLLRSSIRISSIQGPDGYARILTEEDSRFRDFNGTIQSIVTSTAQNDNGLFELNLRDERFLPFEGAGAISRWKVEIPNDNPQFDIESISDIIFHIKYTSREAGMLKNGASDFIKNDLAPSGNLTQTFSLNNDFSNEWYKFTNIDTTKFEVALTKEHFPYWVNSIGVSSISVVFCYINFGLQKVEICTDTITNSSSVADGSWLLYVDGTDSTTHETLFDWLTLHKKRKIYMAVSYITQ